MGDMVQYGPWTPDNSDYRDPNQSHNVKNVVPRADGYGPVQDIVTATLSLPATCRGYFYALKNDGTIALFAGTADRLYLMNNTTFDWQPVSKPQTLTSISNASPAVIAKTAHGYAIGDRIMLSTTGTLPTGLSTNTVYYIISAGFNANQFEVSLTPGGAAINTSSAGSGTHSATGIYTALDSKENWTFAQTGNLVWATQKNTTLQVYDLSNGAVFNFVDGAGSPPQASYVAVVGEFLVLSGLASPYQYRIVWSGLGSFNAAASWTAGVNSSDFQDFTDGGLVRGVAGGEYGVVFQDQAIRRMSYVPGSDVIFQIERISQDKGLFSPYSIIRAGETVFFHSTEGFNKIEPGGIPTQIGRERVDRTFLADLDKTNLYLFVGASDPRTSRVWWGYKSQSGQAGLMDKLIGYDYALDKWFNSTISAEYIAGMSQPGITLDSMTAPTWNVETMTLSLDAYATSVQPELSVFNSSHMLGYFRGSNLEATVESSEQGETGQRFFTRGFRPITDAPTVYGSVSYRDNLQQTSTYRPEVLVNPRTGSCDARIETRYSRYKSRIPYGTSWSFITGIEPDVKGTGLL